MFHVALFDFKTIFTCDLLKYILQCFILLIDCERMESRLLCGNILLFLYRYLVSISCTNRNFGIIV